MGPEITTVAQQRLLFKLMGFDFVVKYRRGKESIVADAVSRREENKEHKGEIVALSGPIPNWVESINEEIQTNPTLQG